MSEHPRESRPTTVTASLQSTLLRYSVMGGKSLLPGTDFSEAVSNLMEALLDAAPRVSDPSVWGQGANGVVEIEFTIEVDARADLPALVASVTNAHCDALTAAGLTQRVASYGADLPLDSPRNILELTQLVVSGGSKPDR